jgi:hypothetical protein
LMPQKIETNLKFGGAILPTPGPMMTGLPSTTGLLTPLPLRTVLLAVTGAALSNLMMADIVSSMRVFL